MAWKELVKSVIHCLSALSRGLTSQPSGDLALLPCSRPAPLCLHFSSLSLLLQSHCPLAAFQTHQPLAHLRVFALAVPSGWKGFCQKATQRTSSAFSSLFSTVTLSLRTTLTNIFKSQPSPLLTQSLSILLYCTSLPITLLLAVDVICGLCLVFIMFPPMQYKHPAGRDFCMF